MWDFREFLTIFALCLMICYIILYGLKSKPLQLAGMQVFPIPSSKAIRYMVPGLLS